MRSRAIKTLLFSIFTVFLIVSASSVAAVDNPFVGKWGYTLISKGISTWYGWKTEAGTIEFGAIGSSGTGTATSTFKESANVCPDANYCKLSATQNHTYELNANGTATLDGKMVLVLSPDGKVAIGDGTFSTYEILFFTAVKMADDKTYSNADVIGQYYGVSYERVMQGQDRGYYRAETAVSTMSDGGTHVNVVRNGSLNGDGKIFTINNDPMIFDVATDGTFDANGMVTGYAGYGKVTVFSNAHGGVADDFMSVIALKKHDRDYTQADLQGTWTISAFGDKATDVRAEFGTIACDVAGTCTSEFMQRKSDGTLASKTRTPQTLSVAADGSINSFLLTNSAPHFSGAIGNDGKVMLLVMNPDSLNDRVLAVAVKKPATQTISLTGKVQDPSGNYVSGIKVEVAGNASIPAVYTNTNGEYTVTGLPSGQDFTLRFTMNGALPTYTPIFNLTVNTTLPTYFRLYPANWTTNPANPANMGIINGRIRESGANWETSLISGATVSPSTGTAEYSINGYTIGGESTFANGQWFVRNVAPGTVVIVAGTKGGTTIQSRRYMAFADGVTSGALFATADTGTIWVSGKIMNGNTPVGGAAVAKVTDNTSGQTGTPGTTTKSDGSFTLTGLPSGSFFYLKVTKDTFVPSYVTYNSTSNYIDYSRPYPLFTQAQLNNMGIESGKGMILGKVRDNHDPDLGPVEGVTISYTSSQGKTYRVMYNDGTNYVAGSATYGNGSFAIFDVAEGDTVTVKATKACWNFSDRPYITHANSTVLSSMKGVHAESCGEETAIQNGFQTAVGLYNQKNEAFFTNYVSQNYFNNGQSYNAFHSNAQNEWANPNFQQMTYTFNGVTITGSDTATINVTWGTGENENIYMKNEGGTWKLYGNQEKYRIDAFSFRQQYNIDNTYHTSSNKYYAGFSIDDPSGSIISATVSGTGIGSSLNFSKGRGNLWFPQPVEFGANPPSNATYTITITDASGQHAYNRTVNGGVAAYATNLKPAEDVSGNITFTFNGISGGQRYHIELFDANWNWKWNTENDNASTSIVYTGPPLQTGTYRFIVSSFIGDNQSQAWEQFNYTASSTPTISFTGKITDVVGNAIQGAEVTKEGDSNIKTLTDGNGDFTLTGLPSGTPFSIRLYKDGFVPVFSAIVNSTSNLTSPRPFKLFTPSQIVSWGIQGTKGVINGAVADINNSSTGLSGATLTATGSGGKSYTVTYEDAPHHFGGTATSANGHYYVLNVDDMDTVTVSVTLPGYSFMQTQRTFVVHAGAMNEGGFFGESTGASETISLTPGWNFISFPNLPTDKSVTKVFADVSSNVRIIWGYDNASKAWKRYKSGVSDNTLTTIEGGKGYWVYMDVSGNITLKDASTNTEWTAQSKTVPLTEGWNLIAYNGTDDTDVATALNGISGKWSIVWYWKDNQWYAKHESSDLSVSVLDKFKKGGAYWIKTGQATDWVQP